MNHWNEFDAEDDALPRLSMMAVVGPEDRQVRYLDLQRVVRRINEVLRSEPWEFVDAAPPPEVEQAVGAIRAIQNMAGGNLP